jgi:hypothetical protein
LIIQKLVDAGLNPNDLKQADAAGMQIWLGQHRETGKSIASQCKAAMKDDMSSKLSEEGRICLAPRWKITHDLASLGVLSENGQ